jgi:hypothetical protein
MIEWTDVLEASGAVVGAIGVAGGATQYILARRADRRALGNAVFVRLAEEEMKPTLLIHNYGRLPVYEIIVYIDGAPLNGSSPRALGPGEMTLVKAMGKTQSQLVGALNGDAVKLDFFDSTKKHWNKTNLSLTK